jgi:hypothetical protein
MAKLHTIARGECLASVAYANRHFWQTLWDHPKNAELRERRGNPHVLYEGDAVFVPDPEPKTVVAATEQRHVFRRKGVPETLRLRFGTPERPRAGVRWVLEIDGEHHEGQTDAQGELSCRLMPDATRAVLTLHPEGVPEEAYVLGLRGLDPVDTPSGLKMRLRNLGYLHGELDRATEAEAIAAMRAFQADQALPLTDAPDDATRAALREAHGC